MLADALVPSASHDRPNRFLINGKTIKNSRRDCTAKAVRGLFVSIPFVVMAVACVSEIYSPLKVRAAILVKVKDTDQTSRG